MPRIWGFSSAAVVNNPQPSGVNALTNGCFWGTHGQAPPAPWQMDTPEGQAGPGWDISLKPSNPACAGSEDNFAARINDPTQSGFSGPDIDERIWQVVEGHGPNLVVEGAMVHHFAYYTDVNVYGGATADGPWALVWTPLTVADAYVDRWFADSEPTHRETTLEQAYAYYKFEFAAMYAAEGPASDEGGVKFTKAYFESY